MRRINQFVDYLAANYIDDSRLINYINNNVNTFVKNILNKQNRINQNDLDY